MTTFTRATRRVTYLTLGLEGAAGAGKTFTALTLAAELTAKAGGRIAGIDSERGKMALYSEGRPFDFDHLVLDGREPSDYVNALNLAIREGYKVSVVDSASHEWNATRGIADRVGAQRQGNTWSGWSVARPAHEAFVDTIVTAPMHTIATFRSKQATQQIKRDGRTVVESLGLAPVTDADMNYEFDLWGSIDHETHDLIITKTRIDTIPQHSVWPKGAGLIAAYFEWVGGAEIMPGLISDDMLRQRIGAAVAAAHVPNKSIAAVVADAGGAIAYVRQHGIDMLIDEARKVAA